MPQAPRSIEISTADGSVDAVALEPSDNEDAVTATGPVQDAAVVPTAIPVAAIAVDETDPTARPLPAAKDVTGSKSMIDAGSATKVPGTLAPDKLAPDTPAPDTPPAADGSAEQMADVRDWRGRDTHADRADKASRQEPSVVAAAPAPQRAAAPTVIDSPAQSSGSILSEAASAGTPPQAGDQGRAGYDRPDGRADVEMQARGLTSAEMTKPAATDFAQLLTNTRPSRTPHHPAAPQQIALNIQRAAADGQDRFTLQLRPMDLGRIDIQLTFNKDGVMRAKVTAENAGTLDMLQRDARGLERALQEAGLKTEPNGLSFSLRDQGGQAHREHDQDRGRGTRLRIEDEAAGDAAAAAAGLSGLTLGPGRVDVRI